MAGYLAAPAPGGKLTAAGATVPLVLGKDAVTIVPGAGIAVRQQGRELVFDAVLAEPPESFGLYQPGAVAAGDILGTWRNTNRGRAIYLRKLLANYRTPPAAGSTTDYLRLKVTDSRGSLAVLPLNGAVRTYLLDQGLGSVLEGNNRDATGTTFSGAVAAGYGFADRFTVTQRITLTGLVLLVGGCLVSNSGAGSTAGVLLRGSILDGAGRVLASGYAPMSNTREPAGAKRCPFPVSVTLEPGVTYFRAFDVFENPPALDNPADPVRMAVYAADGATQGATGVFTFTDGVGVDFVTAQPTAAQLKATTWEGVIGNEAGALPPGTSKGGGAVEGNLGWHVLGSPSGLALLHGDLTFSIDSVGAPDVTKAGSDINIHSVLALS